KFAAAAKQLVVAAEALGLVADGHLHALGRGVAGRGHDRAGDLTGLDDGQLDRLARPHTLFHRLAAALAECPEHIAAVLGETLDHEAAVSVGQHRAILEAPPQAGLAPAPGRGGAVGHSLVADERVGDRRAVLVEHSPVDGRVARLDDQLDLGGLAELDLHDLALLVVVAGARGPQPGAAVDRGDPNLARGHVLVHEAVLVVAHADRS